MLKDLKKGKADKKAIDLQKKKVDDFSTKMKLAEKLAGVALGTSRLNYIDPRITLAWCKEAEFDYKRLFPKTQQVSSGCVAAIDLAWRATALCLHATARFTCVYVIPYAAGNAASFFFARQAKFQWSIDEIINSDSTVKFEW